MKNQRLLAAIVMLALAGCSTGQRGPAIQGGPLRAGERERLLPPQGDPGNVAATDIAFARAALDEGQWTAFARYADARAIIHAEGGAIDAGPWLAAQTNPAQAVSWSPKSVWSSCDGSLAVSFGRFQEPDGLIGSYATVWKLQNSGDYRWTYMLGAIDNPQPAPRAPDVEPGEDVIIVPGLDLIEGKVADCTPRGQVPPAPGVPQLDGAEIATTTSADGTLKWRREHRANGERRIRVEYLRDGGWQEAMAFTVPAAE